VSVIRGYAAIAVLKITLLTTNFEWVAVPSLI
jgi:hypothetical protein